MKTPSCSSSPRWALSTTGLKLESISTEPSCVPSGPATGASPRMAKPPRPTSTPTIALPLAEPLMSSTVWRKLEMSSLTD